MSSALHRAARRINGDAVCKLLKWGVKLFVAVPLWLLATFAPIFWFVGLVGKAAESGTFDPKDFFLFATVVAVFGGFLSGNRFRPEKLRSGLSKAGLWYMLSALSWVLLGTLFALDPDSIIYEHWLIQVLTVACFSVGHAGFVCGSSIWLFGVYDQLFDDRPVDSRPPQKSLSPESPCDAIERRRFIPLALVVVLGLVVWAWKRLSRSR